MSNRGAVQIDVYVPDITYDQDGWEAASARYKASLTKELGVPFETVDYGTGAGAPAFLTTLSDIVLVGGGAVLAAFLLGEKIEKNLEAWPRLYDKLKPYLKFRPRLNRPGAAVIAVHEIQKRELQAPSIRLVGYRFDSLLRFADCKLEADETRLEGIDDDCEVIDSLIHVFEIDVDARIFKVYVDGSNAVVVEVV